MSEKYIDFSALDDTNEAFTQLNGKAIPKYNKDTGRFKLWNTKRHKMVFNVVDIYKDVAKENKIVYANIMLLLEHTDLGNILAKRKGNRTYPINSEKAIMELLGLKRASWFKLKSILFDKNLPILSKCITKTTDKDYVTYYVNPLMISHYKGISITCYRLFRNYLKDYLSDADYYTLEKWSAELV